MNLYLIVFSSEINKKNKSMKIIKNFLSNLKNTLRFI